MNKSDTIYFIPVEDKNIIYMPYKPLAFIGNESMVRFIRDWKSGIDLSGDTETIDLLERTGFFQKDRRGLPPEQEKDYFKPVNCVILLTKNCNLNCVYCYASSGKRENKIVSLNTGMAAIDRVCSNAVELKRKKFSLSFHGGGEPTLAGERINELARYAHSKEIECSVSLTTNGFFKEDEADFLLEGINEVSLSLDGIAPVHNRQRPDRGGKGSFERVFQTLKILEKKKIQYGIRMSVMDDSIEVLPESIEFLCKNSDCRVFQVEPVFKSGRARDAGNDLKNRSRFIESFMISMETAFNYKRHMYYSGVRPWIVTGHFCTAPYDALIVNQDDELTMCYEVFDRGHELGDLFFYGRCNEGVFSSDYAKRRILLDRIAERQKDCIKKGCYCFSNCAGDCPPKAFLSEQSGADGFSGRCELNRTLITEMLLFYIEKAGGIWHGEKFDR